ncbi:hypothetical protein [Micromonospora sp. WMMD812]|uniref:hypothetical protein n=1 Tax=Micromonospora sp. WMMD812 TaxID=3015152 RepID=UPI00248AB266|nr:hypothetical protein [Micromonospora sp. WMMD812]WBB70584.1 hypothetical protein O7603_15015 [Micromonospora sp. WMMD812]
MSLDLVAQIIVGVLGALAAVLPLLGSRQVRRTRRDDLRLDVELLTQIPDGPVRQKLERHILATLDEIEAAKERRRDPLGVTLALILIASSTFGGIWFIREGGWWLLGLVAVAFVFTLGAVGLAQDVSKRKRDQKGRPIE